MAELTHYSCPSCGLSYKETRGAFMSDLGGEKGARRERRRLFMRGFRDRLRGIERDIPPKPDRDEIFPDYDTDENIRCRLCGVRLEQSVVMMLD